MRRLRVVLAAGILLFANRVFARDNSSGCLLGFITLEGAAEKMFD